MECGHASYHISSTHCGHFAPNKEGTWEALAGHTGPGLIMVCCMGCIMGGIACGDAHKRRLCPSWLSVCLFVVGAWA